MKRLLIAGVLLAGAISAGGAQDVGKSALERDPAGWADITPNEKLEHWVRQAIPFTATLGRMQWHLDPAAKTLVCDGDGGHDLLRFDRELGDFILHVEWKFTAMEGKKGYNSGVYVRTSADGKIWHQAQVGSASGGYLFGQTLVGGKPQGFNLSKNLSEQRVKPAGEWNTYEVACRGKRITVWVNGAVQNDWMECEVPRGFLGLEGEGFRIEFRNVKLKELK